MHKSHCQIADSAMKTLHPASAVVQVGFLHASQRQLLSMQLCKLNRNMNCLVAHVIALYTTLIVVATETQNQVKNGPPSIQKTVSNDCECQDFSESVAD